MAPDKPPPGLMNSRQFAFGSGEANEPAFENGREHVYHGNGQGINTIDYKTLKTVGWVDFSIATFEM